MDKKNNDREIIMTGILALIIIGGSWYYLEHNPQTKIRSNQNSAAQILAESKHANSTTTAADISIDTSNWETYKNDLYGFSFKYPQELAGNISEEDQSAKSIIDPPRKENNYDHFVVKLLAGNTEISVEYYGKKNKLTFDDFIHGPWGHATTDIPKNITIDNISGIEFEYDTSINGKRNSVPRKNIQVGLEHPNGGFIVINFGTPREESEFAVKIFNTSLETFRVY